MSKTATTAKCSANTATTAVHREAFQALDLLFVGTVLHSGDESFDPLSKFGFPATLTASSMR
jgi:predicted pyridoxine 5'-phosphate oxidase superfamily flavin-nucleotide-binding protein